MGAKVIAFLEFLLLIVVLITSPHVAVARELTVSDSGVKPGIHYGPITKPRPFCNKNVYSGCIPAKVPPKRKCNYRNNCSSGPPARPEH